jgi:hypothetical protein
VSDVELIRSDLRAHEQRDDERHSDVVQRLAGAEAREQALVRECQRATEAAQSAADVAGRVREDVARMGVQLDGIRSDLADRPRSLTATQVTGIVTAVTTAVVSIVGAIGAAVAAARGGAAPQYPPPPSPSPVEVAP